MLLMYFCSIFPPLPEAQWKQEAITHSGSFPMKKLCFGIKEREGFQFASLGSSSQGFEMLLTVEKQIITELIKLCLAQALDSNSDQ